MRTFKTLYTEYSTERIVDDGQNIMKVLKYLTMEDAIAVERVVKAIKPGTMKSCCRKLCPDVVRAFTGFMIVKETVKEIMDMARKVESEGFQDRDFREIQELIDATPEELMEDDVNECFQTNAR